MKYQRSKDGIDRATLLVPLRVTREDYRWLRDRARQSGVYASVHELLAGMLAEGFANEQLRASEDAAEQLRASEDEQTEKP